ncbi:MAG: NifB/NifX family molybdenum-iron cluster-binding protein [Dehalococcoidales bacterium]|nr:NifB/NifX family molybdenum-iron cluster-binding protein [Dehalococcoidales bacterium]
MKIALVTEDEKTISQHFGRAPYYLVATVEDGKVIRQERRDKAGHHTFEGHHEEHGCHGEKHGMDAGAQSKHATMMSNITDCQVLIAGGMGWGAQEGLKRLGIETIVTDVSGIDEAIKLYLEGKLVNRMERLH